MSDDPSARPYNLPLALDRRGLYYGWVVLFAGTVGIIMSVPGQTMGVSVYTDPLLQSLGVTRMSLSLAYMFGTLGSAFLLPFVGRLLDSVGSRAVAVIASLGLALWLLLLAASPSITHTLVAFTHMPAQWIGTFVAFLGFLGIRHFGQGELTIASRTMMGRWFEKRRGLMLGISGFFVAFGFGVAPLVLNRLIVHFTWQRSLIFLSAASSLTALFAWITFRQSPEACGLKIDGGGVLKDPTSGLIVEELESYTAAQAKRTLTFWAFNLGMSAPALLFTAVTFHMEDIARLNHMTITRAFSVFLPVAFISTAAELSGGFLSDRIPLKYLLAVMQLGISFALIGIHFYGTTLGFALTALGFGIANGLFSLLAAAAWPKLFGRKHLGAIAGINMSWIVAGSAVGPYIFSLGNSLTGSYQAILYICLIIPLGVFACSFFANQPTREQVRPPEPVVN